MARTSVALLQLPPCLPSLVRGRISYTRPLEFLGKALRQWWKRHRYHGNVPLDLALNGHTSGPESWLSCSLQNALRARATSPSPEPQWGPILHHFLVNPQQRRLSAQLNRVNKFAKLGNLYLGCLKVLHMQSSPEVAESFPP